MSCNLCNCDPCDCYCGFTLVGESSYFESGITADEYKEFLLHSLDTGLGCVPDGFSDTINNYWDIYKNLGCGSNDLRYLYVRSAALTALMGCNVFSVNRRTSVSESNSRSESKSKSDSLTQGQSTSANSAYSESAFESGYSDFANSILRAQSQRSAESNSRDVSQTTTDDTGHGEGNSETLGERDAQSDRVSRDKSESSGRSSSGGARWGSDYSFTHQNTDSNAAFILVGSVSREGTRGHNFRVMDAQTSNYTFSERTGTSSKSLTARSWSQSWSQRIANSYFQALMDSYTYARSNAQAFDYSKATSDAEAHSAGKGQSAAETEQRAISSSQRTSETDSRSTSETDGYGNSYSITEYRANSQKFRNLAILLENTNQAINELLSLRAASAGASIGKILFANPDGYCNLGAIRMRLYQPGGLYGVQCCPSTSQGVSYGN